MPFQKKVNINQAPAVEGDFASINPRAAVLAGEGGLVAGEDGVTIARFAWVDEDGISVSNAGAGTPDGFASRAANRAYIQMILDKSTMVVNRGLPIILHNEGDFFGRFAAGATKGQKVFASNTDGSVSAAEAGATVAGCTETKFKVENTCAAGELAKISTWG